MVIIGQRSSKSTFAANKLVSLFAKMEEDCNDAPHAGLFG